MAMLRLVCLGVAASLWVGCSTKNQDPDGAAALWDQFHAAEYRTWDRAPGYPDRRPSGSAHGDAVEIFINDVLAEALAAGEPLTEWPEGSLIVKDGFEDGEPLLVAAMEKREDGWFFAEYDVDGEASYSGSPKVCTDCHGSGADYVRAFGFPK